MIFVDTSFWVGLRNRRDVHHSESESLLASYGDLGLVTSNHVVGETWTYLRRRAGHPSATSFLDQIEASPRLEVVFVDRAIESAAIRWLRRHDEREYSFVDATSFALMRSLKIRRALAFDGDYGAAGFVELRD